MRLDTDRQRELEPKRIQVAKTALHKLGYTITHEDKSSIEFVHQGQTVRFFPYSGWHTGKSIQDGRGLEKLLRQLDSQKIESKCQIK
jgi:hypothetical protein